MTLISTDRKNNARSKLADVFDTFAKDVVLHKDAIIQIEATNSFSGYYGEKTTSKVKTPNSETVKACVKFLQKQDIFSLNSDMAGSQIKIPLQDGSVRFRVKIDVWAKVKKTKKIDYLNKRYEIISGPSFHGFIDMDFVDFFCNPLEE